jgi:hypothetical protein
MSQSQIDAYRLEITSGSEFNNDGVQRRWYQPVKVYMVNWRTMPRYSVDEVKKVVRELQELGVPVSLCDYASQANMLMYYCSGPAYEKAEPGAVGATAENFGFASCTPQGSEIISATMYVDSERNSPLAQRHLIREELTQVMGFMNDSWKYPDSIFFQGWTTTTAYSSLDRAVIRSVYQ